MIVLGINGGLDRADETLFAKAGVHDASATLVRDGEVVAAVEEERFNRYKHSGKLPAEAVRYCLDAAGVDLVDVDKLVFNVLESDVDHTVEAAYRAGLLPGYRRGRNFIQQVLRREFGRDLDPARFEFIDHHYAHAVSAFVPSGFERALVVTLDGMGSGHSGSVWLGRGRALTHLRNYDGQPAATTQSLGHFYLAVTAWLGFKAFDEYKVMGLAPYGDPERLRGLFEQCCELKDDGDYLIHLSRLDALRALGPPRRRDEEVQQLHKDVAAALQRALEALAFHLLTHWRRATGERRLCLAGGVAHNCALNGRVLREGLFDEVFVQPASHDGGLSLGAALHGDSSGDGARPRAPLAHAYLGPSCGADDDIARELRRFGACVEYERVAGAPEHVAGLLAQGAIVGWAQGRAEFGPRALGNRSIVADPRPAEHKDVINAMIKKREAFRPFAPSVLEEEAGTYFELPAGQTAFPYMVFVVRVRERYRGLLGAVTHVDGTARIQTVSRAANERYWRLIRAFGERAGIPIVLNTSFNNNAEPIVTSAEDALVCFLTTDLPVLALGDFVVRKKPVDPRVYLDFRLSTPSHVLLRRRPPGAPRQQRPAPEEEPLFKLLFDSLYERDPDPDHYLGNTHGARVTPISAAMASVLANADGYATLSALTAGCGALERERLLGEALDLWGRRLVRLRP